MSTHSGIQLGGQPGVKIKIPFGKVAAFAASLVVKSRGGFTKEEGQQLLAEFMELLAEVLAENASTVAGQK
jgi:hypothetical protein